MHSHNYFLDVTFYLLIVHNVAPVCIQVWNHVTGDCMKHMRVRGGREVTGLVHHIDKEKIFVTGWNKRISIFPDIANVHVRSFLIIVLGMLL